MANTDKNDTWLSPPTSQKYVKRQTNFNLNQISPKRVNKTHKSKFKSNLLFKK